MNERDIFLAALNQPDAAERSAFLAETCQGDVNLRQRVEALFREHEQLGSYLEAPAAPRLVATIAEPPVSERPGTVIGPYKLLQQIGEGGMGTVFMAEQTHPVQRKVALKLIKAGMDSRLVIARFEAERQALAMMDHVNIARVFEAGATGAGRPYFVMELVHGVPITKYCDDNHLTPRERLELFVPVCQAIQHAHQKGIIHRDIKPSNVMITLYDGKPVPKVIDFGVAKAVEQRLTERTLFTQYGTMVGTLEYMSPEQAEMSALGVDTRSDIYSLGVLLYELLTGSTPLSHKRLKEAAYAEILRMIKEEEPPKPSTRLSDSGEALASISANRHMEPGKLTKLVRGELDWIVMKTLEKDRNRRYETANGFAMDVQRYLNDETVLACPPSTIYRLKKFARRNKTRLAVAAGVFLAVTVMAASIGWSVRDRVARQAESEQAETARRANVEGQVRDSVNMARTFVAENKLASAREKLAQARAQLGNDSSALGDLAAEVAAGEAELGRLQQFLDLIDRAHQAQTTLLLEPTLAADRSTGSPIMFTPARTGDRRPAAAVPFLLEALQLYGVLERDDWTSTLGGDLLGRPQVEQVRRLAYEELLWLANEVLLRQQEQRSGRTVHPEAAARQALVYLGQAECAHRPTPTLYTLRALCRKAVGDEAAAQADTQLAEKTPATMALDHSLRGQFAYDAKQLADGVQAFEAALSLEPTHYWSLIWLGACLCDLGRGADDFAGAARVFTGCILKRPDHGHAYYCRANAYFRLRRYEQALADYSQAIELDPSYGHAWYNRGTTYRRLGQPAKAVADCSKAIELNPRHALFWHGRGVSYHKLGQPAKAVADCSKAIELDPKYALAWYNRGAIRNQLGEPGKALTDFSKAIELDPQPARAWNDRGMTYHQQGQFGKALTDYSKAIDLDPQFALAWNNRGLIYDKLNQPDKAVADYSKAIELDPTFVDAWYNRGLAYHKLNQPDKAVADYSKAVELDPKFVKAWINRGATYDLLRQSDKAAADYSKAIELNPKFALTWSNWGKVYNDLGQPDKAIADCSRAIELDPKFALAWYNRGEGYLKLGQPDKAVADFSKAIELDPKVGGYWNALGVAHYRTGDWKAAVAALDKSLELRQGGEAVDRFCLAMAHRKLGNHDEARRAHEQAVQWLEKNKEALEKNKVYAEKLRRFQAEAEEVLELKKK